jgi:hypothetical protein
LRDNKDYATAAERKGGAWTMRPNSCSTSSAKLRRRFAFIDLDRVLLVLRFSKTSTKDAAFELRLPTMRLL